MKLKRGNWFTNSWAKIKKSTSGITIDSVLGKIVDYFYKEDELDMYYDDELQEARNSIHVLPIEHVYQYLHTFVWLQKGYTVIANISQLNEDEKEQFGEKLQSILFEYGIYCYRINSNCLMVTQSSVERLNLDELKTSNEKTLNLSLYEKK